MQAFTSMLKRRPVVTNVIVYGSLYVGAEFAQQVFSREVMVRFDLAYFFKLI